MKPFCVLLFEDKAGNVFFPHGWIAYDEKTLLKYKKDFKPDFDYSFELGIRWFYDPPDHTRCEVRGGRTLYMIEGELFEAAKAKSLAELRIH